MSRQAKVFGVALMLAVSAPAGAAEWALQPGDGGRAARLTYALGDPASYRFECAVDDVLVTQTGVTKLLDVKARSHVDDGAQVLPPGAAMMALFGGTGEPEFLPAAAVKNPAGGWDLTIRLPRNDKRLKAVGRSEMISLFTTGYTMAVPMDAAARAIWKKFLERCATGG